MQFFLYKKTKYPNKGGISDYQSLRKQIGGV